MKGNKKANEFGLLPEIIVTFQKILVVKKLYPLVYLNGEKHYEVFISKKLGNEYYPGRSAWRRIRSDN